MPWEPVLGKGGTEIPVQVHMPTEREEPKPVEEGVEKREIRRRIRIRREDVIKYGYTIGCPGCQAVSRNAPAQNHTEVCRARIEKIMREEGQERIREADLRISEHVARE